MAKNSKDCKPQLRAVLALIDRIRGLLSHDPGFWPEDCKSRIEKTVGIYDEARSKLLAIEAKSEAGIAEAIYAALGNHSTKLNECVSYLSGCSDTVSDDHAIYKAYSRISGTLSEELLEIGNRIEFRLESPTALGKPKPPKRRGRPEDKNVTARRENVSRLSRNGLKPKDIAVILSEKPATIYQDIRRLRESQNSPTVG